MIQTIFDVLWGNAPIRAVQQFFGASWSWFFEAVTLLGAHEVVALVIALALWLSGRRLAYAILGVVLFALATDMLLWQLIGVPRPHGAAIIVHSQAPVSSFPSGHVVTATTVWGLLAVFGRIPKAAVVGIVLGVMLSRLYLGMHYLGDVLGGVLIGLSLLNIYRHLWPMSLCWFSRRSFRFFVILGICAPIAVLPFTIITVRAWAAFGAALGVGLGMPLEYHYVRYAPSSVPLRWQVLKVLIGLGVVGALIVAFTHIDWGTPLSDVVAFALAALWLALGAPALFAWLRLSRHPASEL
jgi:membrane-associated phospholipid phosphatase